MNPTFFWFLVVFTVLISASNARPLKHYKSEKKLNSKWVRQAKDHNVQPQLIPSAAAAPTAASVVAEKKLSRRNAHHSNYKNPHHKEKYENKMDEEYSQHLNVANSRNSGMQDDELVQDLRSERSKKKLTSGKREALNDVFELSQVDNDADETAVRDSADLKFVDTGFSDDDDSFYNLKAISKGKEYNANGAATQNGDRVYRDAHSARKRFERVSDPDLGLEGGISEDSNDYAELNHPYHRGYVNPGFDSAIALDTESLDGYGELRPDSRKAWKK
ncbi:hypothetical protein J437_LFUL000316 [Ladona fulva]|uniref:Uncharacterized protein n=1 Tax=Ladona fulva TaxID=123851 RepID=A0A8K0K485_LADFU|nr:hypothetical protein J437_LFUL000316 [Ladona fulva]